MSTDIQPLDFDGIKRLLPTELMDAELYAYLSQALVQGKVEGAKVMWSGALDQYPYANNEGVFQASVNIREATFQFDTLYYSTYLYYSTIWNLYNIQIQFFHN